MNKIYKVIWSKAKNCYVVVSEIAKRNGKCSSSLNKKIIASFLAAGLVTALPMSVDAAAYINSTKVSDNGNATATTGKNASAWGNGEASNWRATAFGNLTKASGQQSLAFGYYAQATADNATAWGSGTKASQNQATAFGDSTTASNYRATAWGKSSTASGSDATAFGTSTTASKNNATAFGSSSTAAAEQATAFGSNTHAGVVFTYNGEPVTPVRQVIERADGNKKEAWVLLTADGSIVKTYETFDGGKYEGKYGESYALSYQGIINALNKTPGGYEQRNATAFGEYSIATGADSTAFGYRTAATAWNATAWGHETAATGKRVL